MEELRELGVHTFLRVGTCGASQRGIKLGDLIVPTAAVRTEGTADAYVPKAFPAVADYGVVGAVIESAKAEGAPYHLGVTRAVDALWSDLLPDTMPDPEAHKRELEMWTRAGVIGNDMESSTLFTVGYVRRVRAGSVLLCVDEVGAGEIQHLDPAFMDRMIKVAVGAIRRLIEADRAARQ
jgi:uridine phosphorylase